MKNSGQSALEFLMTYGWALLVVLVFISALYLFGVFDTSRYIPRQCYLQPGLECTSFKMMKNESNMTVEFSGRNDFGYDIGFANNTATLLAENIGGIGKNNYTGTCSPSIVRAGTTYTCIINITDNARVPALGEMRRMSLSLGFKNCEADPDYHTTGDCFTVLAQDHTLTGEIATQMENYQSLSLCGNGICDDNLGETNDTCSQDCNVTAVGLQIAADPQAIPADGTSSLLVTVTVLDIFSHPIEGALVHFEKNTSVGSFNVDSNTTDANGQATVTLTSGNSEAQVQINATSDTATGSTVVAFTFGCGVIISEDTNLTDDLSSTSPGCCIIIAADGVTLDGMGHTISGGGVGNGVCAINRTGVTAKNLRLASTNYGIYFENTNDSFITGNNATPDNEYGIILNLSNGNSLSGNTASSNGAYGIFLTASAFNIFTGNNITNNSGDGISLASNSNSNNFTGNNVTYNTGNGIRLDSISNSNLTGNRVCSNTVSDFSCSGSANNPDGNVYDTNSGCTEITQTVDCAGEHTINDCTTVSSSGTWHVGRDIGFTGGTCCINITADNVVINGSSYSITGDNATGSMGVCTYDKQGITVADLTTASVQYGIYFSNTQNSLITRCNARNTLSGSGIRLDYSNSNNITGTNVTSNDAAGVPRNGAIYLNNSDSNRITGSNASSNSAGGILLHYSDSNTISGNTVTSNSGPSVGGIYLDGSNSNSITGNTVSGNSDGIGLLGNVEPPYAYCCNSNTVSGNSVTNNGVGIGLDCSGGTGDGRNNVISDNNIWSNSDNGIGITSSILDTTILRNNITYNTHGIEAIFGMGGSYMTIAGNNISSNSLSGIVIEDGDVNTIANNTVNSNSLGGIRLHYSTGNTLTNNTFNSNTETGIWLQNSNNTQLSNNTACFNSVIDFNCSEGATNDWGNNFYDYNSGCGIFQIANCSFSPISDCGIISSRGNYYLTDDITFTGSGCCINITSDNVLLDGKYKSIGGNGNGYGVCATGRLNVTVQNATVWGTEYGIYFDGTNSSYILTDIMSGNTYDIYALSSISNTIANNLACSSDPSWGLYCSGSSGTFTDNSCNNQSGCGATCSPCVD